MTTVTLELPDELVTNFDLKQLTKEFTDFLLSKHRSTEKTISPITQSLVGLLANSNLDKTTVLSDWNNAEFNEMAMNQAMRGMENEPALYESLTDDEQNTQQLLEMIKNIKPVTCEYSSEQIVRSLRDGTPLA